MGKNTLVKLNSVKVIAQDNTVTVTLLLSPRKGVSSLGRLLSSCFCAVTRALLNTE
jgi:hypothetical protein